MRSTQVALALGLSTCVALSACGPKNETSNTPDTHLAGVSPSSDESGMDLDLGDDEDGGEFSGEIEDFEIEPWPKLAKPSKPVKKCKGKGKNKECAMADPKPKVSAAHGTRSMMGNYRWGMSPAQVFKLMSDDIDEEYEGMQKKTTDPTQQDRNRRWRAEALQSLKANHVKFTKSGKHRWGVSLIQFEYEDDAQEEMLWVKNNTTLRKFYFFKDDELWKILYAYAPEAWPNTPYPDVVDKKFKKWFGVSPTNKLKVDPKTQKPLIAYYQWESLDSSYVRSFDMTAVNGVIVLAVVDKNAEDRIGERLPNIGRDESFSSDVTDVLGGSDVCYDDAGEIGECPEAHE